MDACAPRGYFFRGGVPSSCVDCSPSIELSSGSPTASLLEVCPRWAAGNGCVLVESAKGYAIPVT
jgi:hypothetical protein